jgi:hypothetical protein
MTQSSTVAAGADDSLQLMCAETFGGNREIHTTFHMPGARGQLFSKPSDGRKGGDVHYLSICSNGLMSRFLLADVAGHGEAVAAVSGELHRLVRRYGSALDHRKLLIDLNRWLVQAELVQLVTAAAFTYEGPARILYYSYAGHPPAWYYRSKERRWSRLSEDMAAEGKGGRSRPARVSAELSDLPLAISAETGYSRGRLRVTPGDLLLVVTDGILEAPNPGQTLFGDEGVERFLSSQTSADPDELAAQLLETLRRHTAPHALEHDDVSFLLIELLATPGPAIWQVLKNRMLQPRGNSHDERWNATLNQSPNITADPTQT